MTSKHNAIEFCIKFVFCEIIRKFPKNLKCSLNFNFPHQFQILTGHTGSVLCLQYDDKVIISGSSDSTVRVWDVKTGEMVNTLIHHCEAVLHLRFNNGMMVTCSKVSFFFISIFKDSFLIDFLAGPFHCCLGYDCS